MSQKLEELLDSILHQECFHVHNDLCKVLFESVDVNIDFWTLSPSPALQTTEMAGFDRPHPISSRGLGI